MKVKPILPTAEEAERIKAGDRELINRYYMANYAFIRDCAFRYCRKWNISNRFYEDLVQDAYLHFSEYSFENGRYFGGTLKRGFMYYVFGGKRKHDQLWSRGKRVAYLEVCLLDAPLSIQTRSGDEEEGATMGEMIAYEVAFEELIEPQCEITDSLYNFLCSLIVQGVKRGRYPGLQLDVFREIYYTGISQRCLAEKLGVASGTVGNAVVHYMDKFRAKRAEIAQFLIGLGYYVERTAEAVEINYGGL